MIDKKTLFILGAGASCPYGYPSGEQLRKEVVLPSGFMNTHVRCLASLGFERDEGHQRQREITSFVTAFEKSSIKSIDLFMARNPKLAPIGKYIIAFEILGAEQRSLFRERARIAHEEHLQSSPHSTGEGNFLRKGTFQGDDWYSYLFNRLTEGMTARDVLPDFSDGKITFITFNYDRSLEHFLFTSLRNSFSDVPEQCIRDCLNNLKIVHIFGQIAPLPWQLPTGGIDYSPQTITTDILQKAAANIKTIFEENETPGLSEAKDLLKQAQRIFILGFGYAEENMNLLMPSPLIEPSCQIYGTAYGLVDD